MRVIYGSQNFGYDMPSSDKDYAKIIFPTIDDIMNEKSLSTTLHHEDNSQTKLIDIRKFPRLLLKSNFNDLQMLYAQEIENGEAFKWFFDNRDAIVKCDLTSLYVSNVSYIHSCFYRYKSSFEYKELVRARAFTNLLTLIAEEKPFVMRDPNLQIYRRHHVPVMETDIMQELEEIKDYFRGGYVNFELVEEIKKQTKDILIAHLRKELENETI